MFRLFKPYSFAGYLTLYKILDPLLSLDRSSEAPMINMLLLLAYSM